MQIDRGEVETFATLPAGNANPEGIAAAVVEEAKCPDPIVLVQDYHFALLPKMIRERLPDATIISFWHIPWPNAETFGICPWKEVLPAARS